MDEFLSFLVEFALWYIFFKIIFAIADVLLSRYLNKNSQDREKLIEKVVSMLHRVKQEQHGDVYYWFDADSDEFLGQGKNDNEIKEHLKKRFRGHIFLLDEERALAGPDLKVVPVKELTKMSV